jgi:uncharacterized protein YjiS (DUF1127 family)
MSVMSFERSTAGQGAGAWQALANMVTKAVRELRREHKARRDRRHLMQLPDYLLRDIGLSRIEIEAMTERYDEPRFVVLPDIAWRLDR